MEDKGAPLARAPLFDPSRPYLRHLRLDAFACLPVRPRLPLCSRFEGEAAFGKATLLKQTFYGFRMHVRVCWPGVITRFSVAPANAHELSVLPEIAESTSGMIVGERTTTPRRPPRSWPAWAWSS